jgi:TPR repeat protein
MYSQGEGVTQDHIEAVKWYRLAAQQGRATAQNNLGTAYAEGKGVPQDYVKAHSWMNLSAIKGFPLAVNNRNKIGKLMTPQQIAEAQQLARDCLAQNFKGCD